MYSRKYRGLLKTSFVLACVYLECIALVSIQNVLKKKSFIRKPSLGAMSLPALLVKDPIIPLVMSILSVWLDCIVKQFVSKLSDKEGWEC